MPVNEIDCAMQKFMKKLKTKTKINLCTTELRIQTGFSILCIQALEKQASQPYKQLNTCKLVLGSS
jgi:hypothetical protein